MTGCREETAAGVRMIRLSPGPGAAARVRCAWRAARLLSRRPPRGEETVRWPEPGPVPVLVARDRRGLAAARLALALSGSPARLLAVHEGEDSPWDPRAWRRADLVAVASPAAAAALREAGVDGRRLVTAAGDEELRRLARRLGAAPLARSRRIDWSLR